MSTYLTKAVNSYRVGTVAEALALREELQQNGVGDLIGFAYTTKYIKEKGEVVEEYQDCKATIQFTDPKEPDRCIDVTYSEGE